MTFLIHFTIIIERNKIKWIKNDFDVVWKQFYDYDDLLHIFFHEQHNFDASLIQ